MSTGGMAPNGAVTPAPPPPGTQVVAPWAQSQGVWAVGDQPWHAAIPEEPVRNLISQKGYKNPAELAVAYHNLNQMTGGGQDYVKRPPANATPEQQREFYSKLGALPKADEYQIKFADGVQTDPAMMKFGQETAYELGLTPAQAQKLGDKWQEFASSQLKNFTEKTRADNDVALGNLKAKWGADYQPNLDAANRAVKALSLSTEAMNAIEASLGAAPLVELLLGIGKASQEGRFIGGANTGANPTDPNAMQPGQARAKIEELKGDQRFQADYGDRNSPGHKAAVERMEQLYRRASAPA